MKVYQNKINRVDNNVLQMVIGLDSFNSLCLGRCIYKLQHSCLESFQKDCIVQSLERSCKGNIYSTSLDNISLV